MVPLVSGVLDICVSSTSFQKMISASLNSLQLKEYQVVVKNWKKRTGIGQLGARDDQTIMISNFFDEMRLSRSLRLLRPLRPLRPLRSLRL